MRRLFYVPFLAAALVAPATASPIPCGDGTSPADLLAFVELTAGPNIATIHGDGSGKAVLTGSNLDGSPALSPAGDLIAFESRRDGNGEIYVMNVAGHGVRNLTNTPSVRENKPTWSPDGRRIAFHSQPITELDLDNPDIEIIELDGTGRTNITNTPDAKEVKPHWSPDGSKIAFEAGAPAVGAVASNDDIWVMDADGTDRVRLTDHPGREWFPAWSPDGSRIAFMSGRHLNFEIYVMNANGSEQTRLTDNATLDGYPTWSPDGSRIVYAADDSLMFPLPGIFVSTDATRADLVAIRPDGSDPVAITNGGLNYYPSYAACHPTLGGQR